jgi:acyl-CoA thioesterase YciA
LGARSGLVAATFLLLENEVRMEKEACLSLPEGQPTIRLMPQLSELNGFGSVFGGWTMAQMDIAAGNMAMLVARGKVTTAAANIDFERPIRVGNIVSFYTKILSRGRTSLKVRVDVFAEEGASTYVDGAADYPGPCGYPYRAASAEFVFVAVDDEGRKRQLPPEA